MSSREQKIVASRERDGIRHRIGIVFGVVAIVIGVWLAETLHTSIKENAAIQEARDRAQRRAELIIMSSSYALIVCDEQGVIVLANVTAAKTFGWSTAELMGRHISDLALDSDRAGLRTWIKSSVSELKTYNGDYINYAGNKLAKARAKDGTTIDIQLSARAIKYHNEIEFILAIRPIPQSTEPTEVPLPSQPGEGIHPLPDVPFDARVNPPNGTAASRGNPVETWVKSNDYGT